MTEQIKDFYEGRCIRAYRFLGCHRAERGYRFLIWAPNARAVAVSGDFNGWSREQTPPGGGRTGCGKLSSRTLSPARSINMR